MRDVRERGLAPRNDHRAAHHLAADLLRQAELLRGRGVRTHAMAPHLVRLSDMALPLRHGNFYLFGSVAYAPEIGGLLCLVWRRK
jgi:hypothetical protein